MTVLCNKIHNVINVVLNSVNILKFIVVYKNAIISFACYIPLNVLNDMMYDCL